MNAIVVNDDSPQRELLWRQVPDPYPGPDEVLVDISATAVNRADLLQRSGDYPPPADAPVYLGLEMAGTVAEIGTAVTGVRQGDRVCALLAGGGYAEQVAVHHRLLTPIPGKLSFHEAAAIPEVFYTAFVNLFLEANLAKGETVLIHAGASGVGTAAIQLAREQGCRVVATAGSQEKLACCRRLGAELAVDYRDCDFAAAILDHCDGADVILDVAGGSHLASNLEVLKLKGRLVIISLLGGAQATIDLGTVLRKRLRVVGSLLRSRPLQEKIDIVHQFRQRFWAQLERGTMAPLIHAVLPVTEAEEAHRILRDNENIGKVVLRVR